MNQQIKQRSASEWCFLGLLSIGAGAVAVGLIALAFKNIPARKPMVQIEFVQPKVTPAEPAIEPVSEPEKPPRDWTGFGKDTGKGIGGFARGIVSGTIDGLFPSKSKDEPEIKPTEK